MRDPHYSWAKPQQSFLGTIGHVAHGKSTVVKAISGVQVPKMVSIFMATRSCQKEVLFDLTKTLVFSRLSDSRTSWSVTLPSS